VDLVTSRSQLDGALKWLAAMYTAVNGGWNHHTSEGLPGLLTEAEHVFEHIAMRTGDEALMDKEELVAAHHGVALTSIVRHVTCCLHCTIATRNPQPHQFPRAAASLPYYDPTMINTTIFNTALVPTGFQNL